MSPREPSWEAIQQHQEWRRAQRDKVLDLARRAVEMPRLEDMDQDEHQQILLCVEHLMVACTERPDICTRGVSRFERRLLRETMEIVEASALLYWSPSHARERPGSGAGRQPPGVADRGAAGAGASACPGSPPSPMTDDSPPAISRP